MTAAVVPFTAAKAGSVPNKPLPEARPIYSIRTVQTSARDVDLLGPVTTVVEGRPTRDAPPFPVLYLSAYVTDPEAFAARVAGALAWLADTQAETARAIAGDDTPPVYAMPEYVEDVDYAEALFVAEDPAQTDWKPWAAAMVRRVNLATTSAQLVQLMQANANGAKLCPRREMASVARALSDAYVITQDQAAGA